MRVSFVSSMDLNEYNDYGKIFLEEFAKFSSKDIKIFVVFTGKYPEKILNIGKNIIILPFASNQKLNFENKFSKLSQAHGYKFEIQKNLEKIEFNVKYDFLFNAIRGSCKPFAIYQCLNYLPNDTTHLVWTDANLICKEYFNHLDLKQFLPHNEEIMAYLGRKDLYSECNFLGFNLNQTQTIEYLKRVVEIYENGEIFSYDQWHDSFIWDQIRIEFSKNYNCRFRDISGNSLERDSVYRYTNLVKFFDLRKKS